MEPLTDLGVSIASDATHSLLSKIKKHICYLFKYKDNLDNLKVATDQLEAKRTDASRLLDDSNSKLKDLSATVDLWRTQANELGNKAHDIISKNSVSCLHLWSRYSLSKLAWEVTQEINQKVEKAPNFDTTFDRPTQKLGDTFNLKGFMEFESRLKILDEILKVLKEEEVSMCSLCGMGGIGKTALVKKLIQRVESDYLFHKVAMVTVSQVPNLEKIQQEIIEQLGLKMDEVTMRAKGKKLNTWLTNNSTLLILDDVWWQLSDEDFENVGIPLGGKSCKIVLTSRNEDECRKMGSQMNFSIGVLDHEEAWHFFRLIAGNCVEDIKLKDTAKKISYECDGLPIAIVTIATALKDKPPGVWNDSLQHLQNSNLQRISGMEKVYSRIELSYNLLNDREAQSCFLLCCLFPEDHDVSTEDLVFYGKGLELYENVDSIGEARDRVEAIIDKLKKTYLLLGGEKVGCVKMHDIIRDFAISISSSSYLIRHGKEMTKWPEARFYENCSAISLTFDKVKVEDPIFLRCPKLKLLRLCFGVFSMELPVGIFEEIKELKVLILEVPSIEQPLSMLKELRTLIIHEPWVRDRTKPLNIGDLLGHDNLRNLEIFKIYSLRRCDDFPVEIGLLSNLKILYFPIRPLAYIPPGVLSKLVKLEELLLPYEFISWGCREDKGERVNASLNEIESLPLTRIKFTVKESSSLGEKFVKNLKRFNILIGRNHFVGEIDEVELSTTLCFAGVDASTFTVNWIISLLRKSESLNIQDVRNLKNLMFLPQSLQLKKIELQYCTEIECFISTPVQASRFRNLSDIRIFDCSKLKYLFPLLVARELRQLRKVLICTCHELKECFSKDDDDGIEEENVAGNEDAEVRNILFPQLRELEFNGNNELRAFYGGNEAIELPSIEKIRIDSCRNMAAFSYGSVSAPKLKEVILNGYYFNDSLDALNASLKKRAMETKR